MNDNDPISALNPVTAVVEGREFVRRPDETVTQFHNRIKATVKDFDPAPLPELPSELNRQFSPPLDAKWYRLVYEEYEVRAYQEDWGWVQKSLAEFKVTREDGIALVQMFVKSILHGTVSSAVEASYLGRIAETFPDIPLPIEMGDRRIKLIPLVVAGRLLDLELPKMR